jgi:hypothetical protein
MFTRRITSKAKSIFARRALQTRFFSTKITGNIHIGIENDNVDTLQSIPPSKYTEDTSCYWITLDPIE